jgi:hypothetical protein
VVERIPRLITLRLLPVAYAAWLVAIHTSGRRLADRVVEEPLRIGAVISAGLLVALAVTAGRPTTLRGLAVGGASASFAARGVWAAVYFHDVIAVAAYFAATVGTVAYGLVATWLALSGSEQRDS